MKITLLKWAFVAFGGLIFVSCAEKEENKHVTLHNALGETTAVIYNGTLNDGENQLQWETINLAKGIYVLRIESDGEIQTIKLVKD